ncbi:MAG: type II and III secretion system protein family protein [Phycisphaerae bacterium]|nr:type II and III secretion system protein family protein [Phycisphaerae bacterium]
MKTTQNIQIKRVPFRNLLLTGVIMGIILSFGLPVSDSQGMVSVVGSTGDAEVTILHRQSQILQTPWKVVRVAITDPDVADVQVLTPDQILIQGLSIGTTDIILWNEDETQILQKKISVVLDVDAFQATMSDLFPMSDLSVSQSGENLIIKGHHRNAIHIQQLHEFLDKAKISYIDMSDLAGVQQVELQVRIAEVSKSGLRSLGIDWTQAGSDFTSGIAPGGQLTDSITFWPGGITGYEVGSSATAFGHVPGADLAFFLDALEENQYLRLLANPTLVALNGEEASFLAGGEYPIPVTQGGSSSNSITIEYKEYGVRLTFRPTVLGDNTIRLYTAPEVSEITSVGGVTVNNITVPALLTRKAETTLELKSGQSFAMAGLLKQNVDSSTQSLPLLGDLPVLGPLFRSVSYQKGETELVILVTANLVEPLNIDPKTAPMPGMLHEAPNDWELYIDGQLESDEPAKLNSIDAEWLKQLGLDQLNGPGAWDSYGMQAPASEAGMVPMAEE